MRICKKGIGGNYLKLITVQKHGNFLKLYRLELVLIVFITDRVVIMKEVILNSYSENVPFNVVTCDRCSKSYELESEEEIALNPNDYTKSFIQCPQCDNAIQQSFISVKIMEHLFLIKRKTNR